MKSKIAQSVSSPFKLERKKIDIFERAFVFFFQLFAFFKVTLYLSSIVILRARGKLSLKSRMLRKIIVAEL